MEVVTAGKVAGQLESVYNNLLSAKTSLRSEMQSLASDSKSSTVDGAEEDYHSLLDEIEQLIGKTSVLIIELEELDPDAEVESDCASYARTLIGRSRMAFRQKDRMADDSRLTSSKATGESTYRPKSTASTSKNTKTSSNVQQEQMNSLRDTESSKTQPEATATRPVNKTEDQVRKTDDLIKKIDDLVKKIEDPLKKTTDAVNKTEDPVKKTEDPVKKTEDLVKEAEDQHKLRGQQRQSLAKAVVSRACLLGSTPSSGLKIYQLPMSLKFKDDKKRIRRFTSGDNRNNRDTKTVIMVGISGSGKSLMINNIVNFIYGVDYKRDFRLKLILEENERNEREQEGTTAMTSWVSVYDLVWQEGFPINFNLTLIDTPGFADDKGVDYDEIIVERIKSMFNSKDTLPKQKLDAIGFVIPASTTRLTGEQKYVFDQILNIFGRDLRENVTVLCTFADAQTPPAIETIKKDGIPIASYHKFNNSAVFAPNDDENEEETEYAWKFGQKNVTKFLQALESLNSQKLDITNKVLDEREGLKLLLMSLKLQIDAGMHNLQKIESMIDEISTLNGTIKQNRGYQVKKSVAEQATEVVYHHITNCPPCMHTCHNPCQIAGDGKEYCWAMNNGKCRMCPGKCDWDVHKNGDRIYKYKTKEVVETIQDMLDKYNICSNRKDAKQKLHQNILEEYRVLKMKLLEDITAAAAASNRLDELALRNNYLTNVDYIKRLIETERISHRPHKQKRIGQLQMVLGMAEILDSAKNNPDMLTSHMSDYERTVHDRIDQLNDEMEDDTPVSGHSSLKSGNRKGWSFGKW